MPFFHPWKLKSLPCSLDKHRFSLKSGGAIFSSLEAQISSVDKENESRLGGSLDKRRFSLKSGGAIFSSLEAQISSVVTQRTLENIFCISAFLKVSIRQGKRVSSWRVLWINADFP
ncbi:hypothetical protein L596_017771 [Steinernema carpocapsae]|uniref:Uncharacterized protein n=1 Tax=Steinernema carpocapsae TaxID=34508 RepID=A0A4U5N3F5_STECR|nr:hypothetical protein L596_017771 [Steinernema carpocapsae]